MKMVYAFHNMSVQIVPSCEQNQGNLFEFIAESVKRPNIYNTRGRLTPSLLCIVRSHRELDTCYSSLALLYSRYTLFTRPKTIANVLEHFHITRNNIDVFFPVHISRLHNRPYKQANRQAISASLSPGYCLCVLFNLHLDERAGTIGGGGGGGKSATWMREKQQPKPKTSPIRK